MSKRNKVIGLGFIILALVFCFWLLIFLDGTFLPLKECRPIGYPDRNILTLQEGETITLTTSDSVEDVLSFYSQELLRSEGNSDEYVSGQWTKEEIKNYTLFSCYGRDINRLTTETGCIYVSESNSKTLIEIVRHRSVGGNTPCTLK